MLDQFDVEPSVAYSGSYGDTVAFGDTIVSQDTIITGFTPPGLPNPLTTRRLLATKTSRISPNPSLFLNKAWVPAWVLEGYASGSFTGRVQRFRKFSTPDERFFDSFVPNPVDIHILNQGETAIAFMDQFSFEFMDATEPSGSAWEIRPMPSGSGLAIAFDYFPKNAGTLAGPSDAEWIFQFPFESKFKSVSRLLKFSNILPRRYTVSKDSGGNELTPPSSSNELVSIIMNSAGVESNILIGTMKSPVRDWRLDGLAGGSFTDNVIGTATPKDIFNIYFGTGQGGSVFGTIGEQAIKGPTVRTASKTFLNPGTSEQVFLIYNVRIDGCKYGLKSITPEQTSAIFRINKFGQLRDMLEQRPYSKFLLTNKGTTTSTAAVTIRFVSGTLTAERVKIYTTASNPDFNPTDSGQFDFEYKSGQPYFDDRDLSLVR